MHDQKATLMVGEGASRVLRKSDSGLVLSLYTRLIAVLEKHLGVSLFIETPEILRELDISNYTFIEIADTLRTLGVFDKISKVSRYADEPFLYSYFTLLNDKVMGGGADFFDQEKTLWRAIAESVERFCWREKDHFYKENVSASYKEFHGNALDIFSLAGFNNEQQQKNACLKFDAQTPFRWTETPALLENKKIWCPVQLLSRKYHAKEVKTPYSPDRNEPMLRWNVSTGLATGRTKEEALTKGILEVIERDAFMITYLNKLSPPRLHLESLKSEDVDLSRILNDMERYRLEVHLLQLPTDFPAHVILALIIDRTGLGPALSVGASADFNVKAAIVDSLSEALQTRFGRKRRFTGPVKDMDREGRLLYWSNPENLSHIDFLLRGGEKKIAIDSGLYSAEQVLDYYTNKLAVLVSGLKEKKYEACYTIISTDDIENAGLLSVNVVIPQMQPLHLDESIPYFGGERLKSVPSALGYKAANMLNTEPHPFP